MATFLEQIDAPTLKGILFFLSCYCAILFDRKILSLSLHVSPLPSMIEIFFISALAIIAHVSNHSVIVYFFASFLFFISWCDAVLINCYGMRVNLKNIITFSKGINTFKGEFKGVIAYLARFNWICSCLFYFALLPIFSYDNSTGNTQYAMCMAAIFIMTVFSITKSKIKVLYGLPWVSLFFLIGYLFSENIFDAYVMLLILFSIVISGAIIRQASVFSLREFLLGNSVLINPFTGGSEFKYNEDINSSAIFEECITNDINKYADEKYAELKGVLSNKNIIIYSIESLSDSAFKNSRYFKKIESLFSGRISAKKAYSVCPNTNQSIKSLYSGKYNASEASLSTFLNVLKWNGYDSTFITTQDAKYFSMDEIIMKCGFDELIDSHVIDGCNDYSLVDYAHEISKKISIGNKVFCHVTNSQTHSSYSVIKKNEFCKYKNTNLKGRYLNAVDESLSIFISFIDVLRNANCLENTMVILTGDHGQSFGEFGYYAHSSSTIDEQVRIPFHIFGDDLPTMSVDNIANIDIMPSLLYLLGVEQEFNIDGLNVFKEKHSYILLYSDTKSGNLPSNVSVIINGIKYYADNVFCERKMLGEADSSININAIPKKGIENIVYIALKKHGFIS